MAKRRIPTVAETLSAESRDLFAILEQKPDFAAVLIATSYLDECLASLLHRFFVQGETATKLLDRRGPLGTFSARMDLAYVLGFLSRPALADLRLIAELRNVFAHSRFTIDLSSPDATAVLDRFSYLTVLAEEQRLSKHLKNLPPPPWGDQPLSPRDKFKLTTVFLLSHLLLKGLDVKPRERFVGWVQMYSASRAPAKR